MRLIIALLVTSALPVSALTPAQIVAAQQKAISDSQAAANRGLETLRQLINESNYRGMGFESVQQVKSGSLGSPIPIFTIDRKDLKEYKPGSDVSSLIRDCNRVVYPVLVEGRVKSGITLVRNGEQWTPAEYGRATLATSLDTSVKRAPGGAPAFVVAVPSQNVYLKGKTAGNQIQFQGIRVGSTAVSFGPPDEVLFSEGPVSGKSIIEHLAEAERRQPDDRKVR